MPLASLPAFLIFSLSLSLASLPADWGSRKWRWKIFTLRPRSVSRIHPRGRNVAPLHRRYQKEKNIFHPSIEQPAPRAYVAGSSTLMLVLQPVSCRVSARGTCTRVEIVAQALPMLLLAGKHSSEGTPRCCGRARPVSNPSHRCALAGAPALVLGRGLVRRTEARGLTPEFYGPRWTSREGEHGRTPGRCAGSQGDKRDA